MAISQASSNLHMVQDEMKPYKFLADDEVPYQEIFDKVENNQGIEDDLQLETSKQTIT